jgi:hypothetical protein
VADPFHVVRVANRCVDKVRRRVQNETLGHRGRKHDPLYRIRKLLLTGSERLDERGHDRLLLGLHVGNPNDEVLGAWLVKESVRDVYLTDDPNDAAVLLDKAITGCTNDDVAEIQSLGRTLAAWRSEILAHHKTGASNGPTEGLNLCVKKVKRCGHGFPHLRALPTTRTPPRGRNHLARPATTAAHQNPHSPLRRVEPLKLGEHGHPLLRALAAGGSEPQAEHVAFSVEVHADRDIDRSVRGASEHQGERVGGVRRRWTRRCNSVEVVGGAFLHGGVHPGAAGEQQRHVDRAPPGAADSSAP